VLLKIACVSYEDYLLAWDGGEGEAPIQDRTPGKDIKLEMMQVAEELYRAWTIIPTREPEPPKPEEFDIPERFDKVEKMVVEKGINCWQENFSEEIQEQIDTEVEKLLNLKNVIYEIDEHLGNLMAGEKGNRIFVFVVGYSGKIPLKLMLIAIHESITSNLL
jgi:hypothetical protein